MNDRIKAEIKSRGLEGERLISLRDLDIIAIRAHCSVLDVMRYIRFGKGAVA